MAKDQEDLGFEPLSEQELGFESISSEPEQSISPALSALRGAEQGLTFGFADELGGAIGAGLEGAFMAPMPEESKLQQLERAYKEYRDMNRARYKQAEEANPMSSLAGNISGGFLMPGAAIGKAATLPAKIVTGAGVGSAAGGLSAAGLSEQTELAPLAKEVGEGAIVGGGLGAALPVAALTPKALKKAASTVTELPIAQDIKDAFSMGQRGISLSQPLTKFEEKAQDLGRKAEDVIYKQFQEKSAEKSQTLKSSAEKLVSLKEELTALKEQAKKLPASLDEEKQMKQKLIDTFDQKLSELKDSKATPEETDKFIRDLSQYTPIENYGSQARDANRLALEAKNQLSDILETQVPKYKEDKKQISEAMSLYETLTGRDITKFDKLKDREALNKKLGDFITQSATSPEAELKLKRLLTQGVPRSSTPGDISEAISSFDFKTAKSLQDEATDVARQYELAKGLSQPLESASLKGIAGGLSSLATRSANVAGEAVGSAKKELAGFSNAMISKSPDQLRAIGAKVAAKGTAKAQELSNLISKASDDASPRKRNALMFGIMQSPEYRELLKDTDDKE